MGPAPSPLPPDAHGEGKLRLSLDPSTGTVHLLVNSSWFAPDGSGHESALQLVGDLDEAWELISEASTWLWRRWKKPLNTAADPFHG